ncbi:MAG: hypothetical protein ACE5KH_06305 [Candidatus Geothermarchaeales archaeon]
MALVLDASVLIVMDELRLLENLMALDLEIITPKEVLGEVVSASVHELARAGSLRVQTPDLELVPVDLRQPLGKGESAVLAICLAHSDYWAILDDKIARRAARELGLNFTGTARLLRFMAEHEALGEVSLDGLFQRMIELNFRIDRGTARKVLAEAPPSFK